MSKNLGFITTCYAFIKKTENKSQGIIKYSIHEALFWAQLFKASLA